MIILWEKETPQVAPFLYFYLETKAYMREVMGSPLQGIRASLGRGPHWLQREKPHHKGAAFSV